MKVNDRTLITLLLSVATLLTACDTKDFGDIDSPAQDKKVPLQLVSGITTTVTRAYDSSWETGDKIGVYTVKAGSTASSDVTRSGTYEDSNIAYVLSGTAGNTATATATPGTYTYVYQGFTAADDLPGTGPVEKKQIYLPIDGSNVDVCAYYPYDNTATSSAVSVTLPTAQDLANQKTCDLMAAKALSATSAINIDHTSAQLLFQHMLSKVIIRVMVGTGYSATDLTNLDVKIAGQATSAEFNPLTQALSNITGNNEITPLLLTEGDADWSKKSDANGDAYAIYRALVMPTATASGSIVITVGTSPNTANYSYTLTQTLGAGTETVYTLRLMPTGIVVTAAITPWSEHSNVPESPLYESN